MDSGGHGGWRRDRCCHGTPGADDLHAGNGGAVQRLRRYGQPAGRCCGAGCRRQQHLHPGDHRAVHPHRWPDLHRLTGGLWQAERENRQWRRHLQRSADRQQPAGAGDSCQRRDVLPAAREQPVAVRHHRAVPLVRHHGGDSHRRCRHAGGDLAAELLFRPRSLCGGFCHQQQHPHCRRLPGRRVGHYPHADHVQGDEPFPEQRIVQWLWQREQRRDRGRGRNQAHLRGRRVLCTGSGDQRGNRTWLRHGRCPGAARGQGTV